MKITTLRWTVPALAMALAAAALAQPRGGAGGWDYHNSCASCHGSAGQGDGPLVRYLVSPPTDLTQLARRNGGVFPRTEVLAVIDGRSSTEIGPHGSREMPIWGNTFVERFSRAGVNRRQAEDAARRRILGVVGYLERMQQ